MSNQEKPDYDEVADALFETQAALVDLREQLMGGAKRSGVSSEQVMQDVLDAYDISGAADILAQTEHEREGSTDPEDFAYDELVARPETDS